MSVSERLIKDVSDEINLDGYVHALRDNDIRHIRNSHGENTNEKYPVTKKDLARIPYIVSDYDKVFAKKNANGKPGIVYVKVNTDNTIYYVVAVTQEYHNQKLLVNKQMIKAGFDDIPNLVGLIDAINKKESSSQYLADLKKIREAYVQDVKENYSTNSIAQNSEKSTETTEKDLKNEKKVQMSLAEAANQQTSGDIDELMRSAGIEGDAAEIRENLSELYRMAAMEDADEKMVTRYAKTMALSMAREGTLRGGETQDEAVARLQRVYEDFRAREQNGLSNIFLLT